MEIQNFFKELFEYNLYSNREIITLFKDNERIISEKSLKLLNHILNAHQIWNERILGENISCEVWGIRPLQNLKEINQNNYSKTLQILKTADLNITIDYKTSKGIHFSNSVRDMIFHVINHSTYHRAQIASDIKVSGIEPLNSDYIFFKRK
jgi:uncharacterized damage-inducible protein DinB